ncbi:MAG: hypothetical protein ACK5Q0_06400, partial [Lysobacteraceae bacterium]
DNARAEIIACVQSMHAVADTLAHVIYFALAMDRNGATKLNERDVSARSLTKKLPLGKIREMVETLKESDGFVYLESLVNHCKHRSLVPIPYHYDLSGEPSARQGFWFAEFTHDGVSHVAREVDGYLKAEYERQSRLVIAIGNVLNDQVRSSLEGGTREALGRSSNRLTDA